MNAKKIYSDFEGAMPDSIGKRIDLFLKGKGISRAEFGRACGTSGTTSVTNYVDGKSTPNSEFVLLAAKKFDINPSWLILGQGPMTLTEAGQKCSHETIEAAVDYQSQVLDLKHKLADKDRELADKDRELASVERAMGKQQGLIYESVHKACRELGLPPDQTRALQLAVMDYEGSQDAVRPDQQDAAVSHQKAVGD
jgi:transcriptional regulator with XRE-family HTH domain